MTPIKFQCPRLLGFQIIEDPLSVKKIIAAVNPNIPKKQNIAGIGIVFSVIRINSDAVIMNLDIMVGDCGAVFKARVTICGDFYWLIAEITKLGPQQAAGEQ